MDDKNYWRNLKGLKPFDSLLTKILFLLQPLGVLAD